MLEMSLYPSKEIQTLNELTLVLRNNYKCVWFLGSGVSKIAGYPLWRELVIDVIGYFGKKQDKIKTIEGLSDFQTFIVERENELIDKCKGEFKGNAVETLTILKNCDQELFNKRIQEIFNECEKNQDNQIFEIISKFIKRDIDSVIITTNIDKGLQNYMKLFDERVTILGAKPVKISSDPKIIYLHGRIDYPDTWVFTDYEYAQAYNQSEHVKNFLSDFLKNIKVLIVLGYSLSEPEIYREFYNKEINIYWIEKYNTKKLLKSKMLEKKVNIKIIPYKGIQNNGKHGLFQVLDYLYNKAYEIIWEERYE